MQKRSYLAEHLRTRGVNTPQSQPIPGRESEMEPNNAGGYTFTLDKWLRLERFLILGTEGGTYYVSERKLTKQNFKVLQDCIAEDPVRTLTAAVDVYESGRAPKVDTSIFAIAAVGAFSPNGSDGRVRALQFVKHLRTGTHLFQWMEYYRSFRGVGKLFRRAVSEWYSSRNAGHLAYQMAKYQNRNGWTHKDVLALCHWNPEKISPEHQALGKWAKTGETKGCPPIITAMEGLHKGLSVQAAIDAVVEFGLTREMLPTESLNAASVWNVLLDKMPLHALVRNLGKMTEVGLVEGPFSVPGRIISSLNDPEYIRKSRLHPLSILTALQTYSQGHGVKGSLKWTPNRKIMEALDNAMNLSISNIQPTNKNIVVGVDVSGSMTAGVNGLDFLTCSQAAMVMALLYMKVEPNVHVIGFDTAAHQIPLYAQSTIKQALDVRAGGGGTDCAVPINVALSQGWNNVDAFVIFTDNETWAGNIHVQELVERYRKQVIGGRPTRLIVVSMEANHANIADPSDPLALQVVGLDTSTPGVINEFIKGM